MRSPISFKQIGVGVGVIASAAYFAATLVWYQPLPTFRYDHLAETTDWCRLSNLLRENVGGYVRIEQLGLYSGDMEIFENGYVVQADDDPSWIIEGDTEPCAFDIYFSDQATRYGWQIAPPPASQSLFPFTILMATIGSSHFGSVNENESEIQLNGVFEVRQTGRGMGELQLELVAPTQVSGNLEASLRCDQLVESWGGFMGRIACPLAIFGS